MAATTFLVHQGVSYLVGEKPQDPIIAEVARAVQPQILDLTPMIAAPSDIAALPTAPTQQAAVTINNTPALLPEGNARPTTPVSVDPTSVTLPAIGPDIIRAATPVAYIQQDFAPQDRPDPIAILPAPAAWQPTPETLTSADPFFETQQFINEVVRQIVTEELRRQSRLEFSATQLPRVHTILAGESLADLAERYFGDREQYMRIFDANPDILPTPDVVKVGQQILIPQI